MEMRAQQLSFPDWSKMVSSDSLERVVVHDFYTRYKARQMQNYPLKPRLTAFRKKKKDKTRKMTKRFFNLLNVDT